MFSLMPLIILLVLLTLCVLIFLYGLLRARLVPYVKTLQPVYDVLLQDLHLGAGSIFIELGAGDAETLLQVTRKFPRISARGYEIALWPYIRARMLRRRVGGNYRILRHSFMRADLADADVLYCYLLPHFMASVWRKLSVECKPGTLLYSYAFAIPDVEPIRVLQPQDTEKTGKKFGKLYVYEVGAKQ